MDAPSKLQECCALTSFFLLTFVSLSCANPVSTITQAAVRWIFMSNHGLSCIDPSNLVEKHDMKEESDWATDDLALFERLSWELLTCGAQNPTEDTHWPTFGTVDEQGRALADCRPKAGATHLWCADCVH
jgi:hypothetical protein